LHAGSSLTSRFDPNIVRKLIEGAARAASSSNLQPWNVYAVTGGPLTEIRRQAVEAIEQKDWRTLETEYPEMPENLWEPYLSRRSVLGAQLYSSLGISRDDWAKALEHIKQQFRFFNAPLGLFITRLIAGWALVSGRTSAAMSARWRS
jgi:hypothetical protein